MTDEKSTIEQELLWEKNDYNFFNKVKEIFTKIKNFLKKNESKITLLIPIAIISVIFMITMIIITIIHFSQLNKSSNDLYSLEKYNINDLKNNDYTKDSVADISTINELININNDVEKEISRYWEYFDNMQIPYNKLMTHILLPELNIWKDNFFWNIDTTIIWAKFLEKNPYNDITLINTWTNFFKNVGVNNEYNDVKDIIIWNMVEDKENDLFYIPMTIKFVANSKRSFLLLVENLSITSNQKNISLINEFIYNLRQKIKEEKSDIINELQSQYEKETNQDTIIWYNLYEWIINDWENKLIDENVIKKAIEETANCDKDSYDYCLYKFRDKYRWIPSIAYTLWSNTENNKVQSLKDFIKKLPPIIKINSFTFNRDLEQDIQSYENIKYEWEIQMNIYWKGITDNEINEIANELWKICIGKELTPTIAIQEINKRLVNIGNTVKVDAFSTSNLLELESIIQNIESTYDSLSNYNKVIKLFEIYRMMKEWNVCN